MEATPEPNPTTSTGVAESVVVPSPSSPWTWYPQHLTAPAEVTAHELYHPAETEATPEPNPTTSTGVAESVVVPSPSSPSRFQPQHLTAPVVVTAHESSPPAETEATPEPSPTTSTGVVESVVVPSPSPP